MKIDTMSNAMNNILSAGMKQMELKKSEFDTLSYPKWKRIGPIIGDFNESIKGVGTNIENMKEWSAYGAKILKITHHDPDLMDIFYLPYEKELGAFNQVKFGTDRKYVLQGELLFNTGHVITIPPNVEIPMELTLNYDFLEAQQSIIDNTFIKLGKGSKASIVISYTSTNEEKSNENGFHNGLVRVYLEEGAVLHLIILQQFNENIVHIENTAAILERDANMKVTGFDLGGDVVVSDYSAHLIGNNSNSQVMSAYLGNNNQKIDIGYNTIHYGERSESLVETKGALMGNAKKIFRGNLVFKRGAAKSKGRESEYVLLLDENVHSDAIPALLCDEDDVIGEHAASAGQVSEAQLFYLMSRGFDVKEAKKLIIHGSFSSVIDCLPTESLKHQVEVEIERRLLDAK